LTVPPAIPTKQLEIEAGEIRFRATRRIGQLVELQKATVGVAKAGRPKKTIGGNDPPINKGLPTLLDAGIDKNLAKLGRKACEVFRRGILRQRARP
jgi:hypothetical protein